MLTHFCYQLNFREKTWILYVHELDHYIVSHHIHLKFVKIFGFHFPLTANSKSGFEPTTNLNS